MPSCAFTGAWVLAGSLAAGTGNPAARPNATQPPEPHVKVGDAAPDFTLPYLVAKPDGGFATIQVRLADYKGKQNVVLAFFPAAFSPG